VQPVTIATTGLVEHGEPDPWAQAEADAQAQSHRPGLLPEEFWKARPIFGHIRQAAHSQGCSGDVLLWTCLARLSGMISHHVQLVTGIAGRGSLNIFAAPVGTSGAGKSTGTSLAKELMPSPYEDFLDGLPIGTGEGIAESFMGVVDEATGDVHQRGPNKGDPIMVKVRKQMKHNAYFYVDEGQALAQLGSRSGSTLGETIRRAAVGQALGQTNASEDRKRFIAQGSYSMGLVAGFQPSTAVPLLADGATGTPQRFFWLWASDPSIPDEPPEHPGELGVGRDFVMRTAPLDIRYPKEVKNELWARLVAKNRGELEVDELDGHADLMKAKAAGMFAILDGRDAVTVEDWELAQIAWKASCEVRSSLVRRAEREASAAREREDNSRVLLELKAHDAKQGSDLRVERVALNVRQQASVPGGITRGKVRKAIHQRDRDALDKAIDVAIARGWVYEEGDRLCVKIEN
jgi:hypothetical protein